VKLPEIKILHRGQSFIGVRLSLLSLLGVCFSFRVHDPPLGLPGTRSWFDKTKSGHVPKCSLQFTVNGWRAHPRQDAWGQASVLSLLGVKT